MQDTACEIKHDGINYDQPVDFGVYCFQTNPNKSMQGPGQGYIIVLVRPSYFP